MAKQTIQGFMQLGKNGLTENFLYNLKNSFNTHENVKISVLKSARQNKEMIKEIAQGIVNKLGKNYTYKIIGFAIFVKKWRKFKR